MILATCLHKFPVRPTECGAFNNNDGAKIMIGKIVTFFIVSVSLILSPMAPVVRAQEANSPQMSPVPDGSVQYELYSKKMDLTIEFSRDMRATLDRTTFDLDALLASLDYDA